MLCDWDGSVLALTQDHDPGAPAERERILAAVSSPAIFSCCSCGLWVDFDSLLVTPGWVRNA